MALDQSIRVLVVTLANTSLTRAHIHAHSVYVCRSGVDGRQTAAPRNVGGFVTGGKKILETLEETIRSYWCDLGGYNMKDLEN